MADWYISSTAYAAVLQWAASTTYAVGAIRRQLATPAASAERCFRVSAITTGVSGGTEPAWVLTNNGVTTDGGVTWTECTGQSTHQHDNGVTTTWTAPAATIRNLEVLGKNIVAASDRLYFSSDHSETFNTTYYLAEQGTTVANAIVAYSVNKAGSIPPAAVDVTPGASLTITTAGILRIGGTLIQGIYFSATTGAQIGFGWNSGVPIRYLNGRITWGSTAALVLQLSGPSTMVWEQVNYISNTATSIQANVDGKFKWRNSTLSGSAPPNPLFTLGNITSTTQDIELDGMDLSGLGSGALIATAAATAAARLRIRNSRLWAAYNLGGFTSASGPGPTVEAINVGTGATNYVCEKHNTSGDLTTDISTTLSGGATNGTTAFAHKIITTARATSSLTPFEAYEMSTWVLAGATRTARVEIIGSAALNADDIWLEIQYPSSASFPLGALASSFASGALPSSGLTWVNPPATPQRQYIEVSFTPLQDGPAHGIIKVGKASTTVWFNPAMSIA
jgi:hypothetical protein